MRRKNEDWGYPWCPSLPEVRCLDSAGETVNGHCGQSPEPGNPSPGAGWASLHFPAAWGHAGAWLWVLLYRGERENRMYTTLQRAEFCVSFQEHIELEILNLLYLKCSLALKIRKSVVWTQLACARHFSECGTGPLGWAGLGWEGLCFPLVLGAGGSWWGPAHWSRRQAGGRQR